MRRDLGQAEERLDDRQREGAAEHQPQLRAVDLQVGDGHRQQQQVEDQVLREHQRFDPGAPGFADGQAADHAQHEDQIEEAQLRR